MPKTVIQIYCKANGRTPLLEWLTRLQETEPRAFVKCLERVMRLSEIGYELRRPLADSLRDGIYELRADYGNVCYRIFYFFHGRNVAVLSHGITKVGKVPAAQIDKAVAIKKQVESNPEKYTATLPIDSLL